MLKLNLGAGNDIQNPAEYINHDIRKHRKEIDVCFNLNKEDWQIYMLVEENNTRKPLIDPGYFQNYSGSEPRTFAMTFDFVPRMCSKSLCDFCIFEEDNKLSDLCTKDEKKFCPVVLISCGYANRCKIEGCPVIDNCGKR